jgi:putative flippase GtrA
MLLPKLILKIQRNLAKLIRFGIVGSTGAIINFSVYYLAFDQLHFGVNLSAIFAFCISVTNNYILNHWWTFSDENEGNPINISQFVYYFIGNLQGLGINLIVLNMTIYFIGINYHFAGQALGIAFGMASNFMFAKRIVFSKKKVRE